MQTPESGKDLRRRFFMTLLIVYAISLPVISVSSYLILTRYAYEGTQRVAKVFLGTIDASRQYVGNVLRPALQHELGGKFILEGMSRSFVSRKIAELELKSFPDIKYKHASLNPLNPVNRADKFEASIIRELASGGEKTWDGFIDRDGVRYYVLAKAGDIPDTSCLQCHGEPSAAPKEVTSQFGTASGFHLRPGELIDALFVYVPASIPLAYIRESVMVFAGLYTVFFAVILLAINRRFRGIHAELESGRQKIESFSQEILNLNQEMEGIVAERTLGMVGLRVADRIRNPVAVIGGITRRLTKCDEEGIKEKSAEIIEQCRKIEQSIEEFEALVKSKRYLFKSEDLSSIVRDVIDVTSESIAARKIELILNLSPEPAVMKANRRYLLMAVSHLIGNAIEATHEGGSITVSTAAEDNNVSLTVRDTGEGISKENLGRIFEPFFSTRRRIGLGLTFVRQIVDEHMGEVGVVSVPGEGTTVTLTFPSHWVNGAPR